MGRIAVGSSAWRQNVLTLTRKEKWLRQFLSALYGGTRQLCEVQQERDGVLTLLLSLLSEVQQERDGVLTLLSLVGETRGLCSHLWCSKTCWGCVVCCTNRIQDTCELSCYWLLSNITIYKQITCWPPLSTTLWQSNKLKELKCYIDLCAGLRPVGGHNTSE